MEAGVPGGLAAWRRSPLLHFVVLGVLLLAAQRAWLARSPPVAPAAIPAPEAAREAISLGPERLAALRRDFTRQHARAPTADEFLGAASLAIDEAILEAEARRLGLGFGEPAVDRRLAQKMRAVSGNPGAPEAALAAEARRLGLDDDLIVRRLLREKLRLALQSHPDDALVDDDALRAHLGRHRERYVRAAAVSFAHVFVSTSRRGERAREHAQSLLGRLQGGILPPASEDLSDAFPLGLAFREQPEDALSSRFGEPFARAVLQAPAGQWSGPHASTHGLHLVRVTARVPGAMPPLDAVRERATLEIRDERAMRRLAAAMRQLRADYDAPAVLAAVRAGLQPETGPPR